MMSWHCVYTKPQAEVWAQNNLWERGLDVYLPRYAKRRRHARRVELVPAPLFPRYLFVRADLAARGVRAITYAPGVSNLVGFGGRPAVVHDSIIAGIRIHEGDDRLVDIDRGKGPASRFQEGDRVHVNEGAFADLTGLFQCRADHQRVFILLDLLGRQVRVSVGAEVLSREG